MPLYRFLLIFCNMKTFDQQYRLHLISFSKIPRKLEHVSEPTVTKFGLLLHFEFMNQFSQRTFVRIIISIVSRLSSLPWLWSVHSCTFTAHELNSWQGNEASAPCRVSDVVERSLGQRKKNLEEIINIALFYVLLNIYFVELCDVSIF